MILCNDCLHAAVCENITKGTCDWYLSEEELKEKWISVSERLPEKNMACLVSVGNFHLTQIAMYSDLMQTINHKIFYQGDYGHENFMNITEYVKAWQPLPEPYKEGGADMLKTEENDNERNN